VACAAELVGDDGTLGLRAGSGIGVLQMKPYADQPRGNGNCFPQSRPNANSIKALCNVAVQITAIDNGEYIRMEPINQGTFKYSGPGPHISGVKNCAKLDAVGTNQGRCLLPPPSEEVLAFLCCVNSPEHVVVYEEPCQNAHIQQHTTVSIIGTHLPDTVQHAHTSASRCSATQRLAACGQSDMHSAPPDIYSPPHPLTAENSRTSAMFWLYDDLQVDDPKLVSNLTRTGANEITLTVGHTYSYRTARPTCSYKYTVRAPQPPVPSLTPPLLMTLDMYPSA
jgi:hypothetical protein